MPLAELFAFVDASDFTDNASRKYSGMYTCIIAGFMQVFNAWFMGLRLVVFYDVPL